MGKKVLSLDTHLEHCGLVLVEQF